MKNTLLKLRSVSYMAMLCFHRGTAWSILLAGEVSLYLAFSRHIPTPLPSTNSRSDPFLICFLRANTPHLKVICRNSDLRSLWKAWAKYLFNLSLFTSLPCQSLCGDCNNMGFGTAFLSLCLFVSVKAQLIIGVSSYAVKTLEGATEDGSAVAIRSIDEVSATLPSVNWFATAWVQIQSGTADSARLLQFKGFSGTVPVLCFATWTSTAPPTFTFGTTEHAVEGYTNSRQENTWFHLLMASQIGASYGTITFRATTRVQYSVSWPETVQARRESSLIAPVNANPFNVSSK
jgi:hypothetical protein